MTNKPPGPRYVLWIDAVGGYLVCRDDQITIGQAIPGNRVDVPIQADLRGKHALIRREDEQYLIEPTDVFSQPGVYTLRVTLSDPVVASR